MKATGFPKYLVFALALYSPLLLAEETVTDGSLSVDVENDGTFDDVFLNGNEIDGSGFVQRQESGGTCSGFSGGSAINVAGPSATYTATCGGFDVSASSHVLGPLPSNPSVTGVFRQVFVYTNNTGGDLPLESVSYMDQDLVGSGNDLVFYDAGIQAVVATDVVDASPDDLLWATIASNTCGGTFGWDVDLLGSQSTSFPMDNGVGPVGPADTAMAIGFDCGTVGPGQSVTFTYEYLFATDLAEVPPDFGEETFFVPAPVPVLSFWAVMAMTGMLFLAGLFILRRRMN